ncbi:MAG: MFS transporter [Sciscionella sp.]
MRIPPARELLAQPILANPDLRRLTALRVADALGKGIFVSGSVIYFTLATGLSATQVSLGVSASGLAGFAASLLLGPVSDRIGARRLTRILLLLQAIGFALYPLVRTVPAFFALIVVLGFLEYGRGPASSALVGSLVLPDERVRVRAMLRTVFNIGFSAGSGIAALAVLDRTLLNGIPLATAVLLLVAIIPVSRLPVDSSRKPAPEGFRRFSAIRDLRFVSVVGLSALLATHVTIVLVTLPLWALNRTTVPAFLIPLFLIANTVFVTLFQVRASKGADTLAGAGRLAGRSGWWLATGCAVAAVSAVTANAALTTVVLVAAMLLFSVAEVMQSASAWGMAYELAPQHAQAEYLGTFDLHVITQNIIGPALVSGLVLGLGGWGWLVLAAMTIGSSLVIAPAAVRSAKALT